VTEFLPLQGSSPAVSRREPTALEASPAVVLVGCNHQRDSGRHASPFTLFSDAASDNTVCSRNDIELKLSKPAGVATPPKTDER
jgi:hypothetical protein